MNIVFIIVAAHAGPGGASLAKDLLVNMTFIIVAAHAGPGGASLAKDLLV